MTDRVARTDAEAYADALCILHEMLDRATRDLDKVANDRTMRLMVRGRVTALEVAIEAIEDGKPLNEFGYGGTLSF